MSVSRPFLKLDTRSRQVGSFPPLFKIAITVHMKLSVSRLFFGKPDAVPVKLAISCLVKTGHLSRQVGSFSPFFKTGHRSRAIGSSRLFKKLDTFPGGWQFFFFFFLTR